MKTDNSRILRRSLLAGLGTAGAVALLRPLLQAEAQAASPQRLLIIHRPCGSRPEQWFPTTGGVKDWGMTPLLSSFEQLRSDMVVMKGIDLPRNDEWGGDRHGGGIMSIMCPPAAGGYTIIPGSVMEAGDMDFKNFTAPSPSVDQELLKNVPALQGTPIASLQLGAALESMKGTGDEALRVLSYADFNQALWPESRPNVAFDNIFGGVVVGGDPTAMNHARARNKSVLDFMTADLNRLKARVPMSQLPKLESHLAAIRSLETQGAGVSQSCQKPVVGALPTVPANSDLTLDDVQHGQVASEQLETIRSAFLCDLTRVATFTFGFGNSELKAFGSLTVPEGHHTLSHNGDASAAPQAAVDKFSGDITAKFLLDMKNTPDGTGSLLDNTLVVYFSECTLGAGHTIPDNPIALFGGRSLGLNGGSYLQFSGRTHADLWVETFRRFGYNKPMHGAAQWNLGPLPGLYG